MVDRLAPAADEVWKRIATPGRKAAIVKGVICTAMSLGLSPTEAGELFSTLDNHTANNLAYGFSGVADGETVKLVGQKLGEDPLKK